MSRYTLRTARGIVQLCRCPVCKHLVQKERFLEEEKCCVFCRQPLDPILEIIEAHYPCLLKLLTDVGIKNVDALVSRTAEQILEIKGIGWAKLDWIREILESHGRYLSGDPR